MCPAVSDPLDGSPPGSSVHGVLQARTRSGLPIPPPGDLPDPRIKPLSLISPASAGRFFTTSVIWEPLLKIAVPQLRVITPEVTVNLLETGSSLRHLQYQPLCQGVNPTTAQTLVLRFPSLSPWEAIFSPLVGHLFTLWIVSLAVQKLFSLM